MSDINTPFQALPFPKDCYVRDRAWLVRLYGETIIDRTGAQTMLYLTYTTITRVDLAHYGVSRAKDWVSVDCGTMFKYSATRCYPFLRIFKHLVWILAYILKLKAPNKICSRRHFNVLLLSFEENKASFFM